MVEIVKKNEDLDLKSTITGFHRCNHSVTYGDWTLPQISNDDLFLYLNDIAHLLTDDRRENLYICDISWKG